MAFTSFSVISIVCSRSLNKRTLVSVSAPSSVSETAVFLVSARIFADSFPSLLTSLFISSNLSCNTSVFSVSILNSHSLVI